MRQLILLYWGCVFLMYLSQVYYPTSMQLEGPQTGRCHFMLRKADVFMIAAIVWMTCFSFLRTSYNDTGTYIAHFMDSESVADYFARNGLLDWTGNPLSELYRDAMRDITTNYHIYFFFPAFLSSFAVVKLCKKYSVSPALSLLVFFFYRYICHVYCGTKAMLCNVFPAFGIAVCNRQEICEILPAGVRCGSISYTCIHVCNCAAAFWKAVGESYHCIFRSCPFCNGDLRCNPWCVYGICAVYGSIGGRDRGV